MDQARAGSFEFDYVIIGGGSAGCVAAGQLSADPRVPPTLSIASTFHWYHCWIV